MVYVATRNVGYLALGIGGGSAAAVVAYHLFGHVRQRVSAWKDPMAVYQNEGYQIVQSLFAIGTGGWFGMGLYQGSPESIPVVKNDFIFSAICEELGGIFAICLSKYFSIRRHDFSTDNAIGKSILTCIIRTVDKIIAFYGIKIDEITDQSYKYNDKKE